MRTNGYLYIKQSAAASGEATGFDGDGDPISGTPTFSSPIPCSIKTVTDSRKGRYEDGIFRQASFEVLLEQPSEPFTAKEIRLERFGETLGDYSVQSVEQATLLGRIIITV